MITGKIDEPVKVRDYSDQNFTPDDEKDFEVKTLREERLIDTVPELDELFEQDMYNLGNADDLPDSRLPNPRYRQAHVLRQRSQTRNYRRLTTGISSLQNRILPL